jgi:hypothetical protein
VIVKHIPARPAGRNATVERAAHARNLVDYLRLPEKDSAEKAYQVAYMLAEKLGDTRGERLFHIGGRGFISMDIEGQRAEMIAVAQSAKRSPNPIDHWLLSWREGELPTPAQVDATVALFLEHLGVAGQPCIYACHGDTDNRHVHMAINRYDPVARRMIEINDGFTHEAAHQAVALIVDRFGWAAEADARYEVAGGRPVLTASAQARIAAGRESIRPNAAAFENRTGYRSAQRIAQEDAVPLIKAAASWRELHDTLAAIGIGYDVTGTNGVTLTVGGERVKASTVDRAITRTRLEKKLGVFEPRDASAAIATRSPVGDRLPEAFRAEEYRAECERWRRWQEGRRAGRAAAVQPMTAVAKARAGARQLAKPPDRPPPDLESWYYARREGVFAERWRRRQRVAAFPALTGLARAGVDLPERIDGYRAFPCSDGTRYARGPNEPTAFVDRGDRIEVVAKEDVALLAALRLAMIRFDGKVSVRGDADFRERVFVIAEAHGLGQVLADADFVARREAARTVARVLDAPAAKGVSTVGVMNTSEKVAVPDEPAGHPNRGASNSRAEAIGSVKEGQQDIARNDDSHKPGIEPQTADTEQVAVTSVPDARPNSPQQMPLTKRGILDQATTVDLVKKKTTTKGPKNPDWPPSRNRGTGQGR